MSDAHIFVTRSIPEPGLKILRDSGARVTVYEQREDRQVSREALVQGVKGSDVLVSLLTERVDRELLAANGRLRGVANMAVGFSNIDLETATELGIPVSNTPGVLTDSTADLTWALLLAVARHVPQAHDYMVAGRYKLWGPNLFLGTDVSPGATGRRKVLGIVGFGRIGSAVARRAMGFDMEVLAYDPYSRDAVEGSQHATWAEFPELLEKSDFVTLHPLLTEETYHLIDEHALRRMKSSAYLVNASRGAVVDERALVKALQEGWIAGAGLDVYENEPEMAPGLAELENVVLLPHIASASHDTRTMMATLAATNAVAHLERQPAPNIVNPEVYETEAYRLRLAS